MHQGLARLTAAALEAITEVRHHGLSRIVAERPANPTERVAQNQFSSIRAGIVGIKSLRWPLPVGSYHTPFNLWGTQLYGHRQP